MHAQTIQIAQRNLFAVLPISDLMLPLDYIIVLQ